ncbi:MAG: pyruvate formate lyase family protein [Lachnospirales bacterium]
MKEIKYVLEFTKIYCSQNDILLREGEILKFQVPHSLHKINDDDLIVGLMKGSANIGGHYVGFSSQYSGLYSYYFHEDAMKKKMEELKNNEEYLKIKKEAEAAFKFWQKENTKFKVEEAFRKKYGKNMSTSYEKAGVANADVRIAGMNLDFKKLIEKGVEGLLKEIKEAGKSNNNNFYKALKKTIESFQLACDFYIKSAEESNNKEKDLIIENLNHIKFKKPKTFHQGLQLMWLYSITCDLMNYGRIDNYLGDLYVKDIKDNLTEERAIDLISSMYKHMITIGKIHDCRIIIGGLGRNNPENADELAMVVMETSRRVKALVPQLTLRYYSGIADKVYTKALEVNMEGCTFPIIYSDDTNVPAVMKAYNVSYEEALNYLPFGCGEYVLEGLSTGTPNNGVNVLKNLELTLGDGYDHYFKTQVGIKTGRNFKTFDDLYDAFLKQLQPWIEKAAYMKNLNFSVASKECGYLQYSLLLNDCIAKGSDMLNGGARYLNASSEVFGIISCADSLMAIKKLVYDENKYSLEKLIEALDHNFIGYENIYKDCKNAPKYGNDIDSADEMAKKVFNSVADMTIDHTKVTGLNKYLIVSVNNSMSAEWGTYCIASPDGRKNGEAMSNGNGPSIGADKNGVTSLLNSLSKFDNSKHVGVINNIRFSKEMFESSFQKVKFLLQTFYENNGVQTNICVIGKNDLENAMKEPEKYKNLIVRIGGFSARFVDLNEVTKREIINRTTYES